jgi:hypothetical protein
MCAKTLEVSSKYSANDLRSFVRDLHKGTKLAEGQDIEQDEYFKAYLIRWYSWSRMCVHLLNIYGKDHFATDPLLHHLATKASNEEFLSGMKIDLFEFAVGLVSFGHLPAVYDVVENMQEVRLRVLASCLYLLPLPTGIDLINNLTEVKNWFEQNRLNLYWDKSSERFLFKSHSFSGVTEDSLLIYYFK